MPHRRYFKAQNTRTHKFIPIVKPMRNNDLDNNNIDEELNVRHKNETLLQNSQKLKYFPNQMMKVSLYI